MTPNDLPLVAPSTEMLARYLAGESSPAERNNVDAWAAADPDAGAELDQLWTVWTSPGSRRVSTPAWSTDGMREALLSRVNEAENAPTYGHLREFPGSRTRMPFSRAAMWGVWSVVLLVAGALLLRVPSSPDRVRHYQTSPGQQSTVRFADGSLITLAPATTLEIESHKISLRGEAYFRLVPNSHHPRTIHTNGAVVNVLGTTFVVRQYADEAQSQVFVEDGKISVQARRHAGAPGAVLARNMVARVTDSTVTVERGISPRTYVSWTRGVLIFERVPLRKVVAELERAYGTSIRIPDSTLAAEIVVADVDVARVPLARVLDFITTIVNAHYTKDGTTYVVVPGRGNMPASREMKQRIPLSEKQYGR
jgi:transmembrane sensor